MLDQMERRLVVVVVVVVVLRLVTIYTIMSRYQQDSKFYARIKDKLNLNDSCLEICSWARSSAWLERSTDNRKVMCSNHIGPIFISCFETKFLTTVKHHEFCQTSYQI